MHGHLSGAFIRSISAHHSNWIKISFGIKPFTEFNSPNKKKMSFIGFFASFADWLWANLSVSIGRFELCDEMNHFYGCFSLLKWLTYWIYFIEQQMKMEMNFSSIDWWIEWLDFRVSCVINLNKNSWIENFFTEF